MKKLLVILFFTTLFINSNAQQSTFKVGGNFNADVVSHKSGSISYASWEASYERSIGKLFSINFTYNYSKQQYDNLLFDDFILFSSINQSNTYGATYGATKYIDYNHTLIIEFRFYLKPGYSGLFFQAGIPFTYVNEKTYYISSSGLDSYFDSERAISTIAGFGIKYPFSKSFGVEMSMNYSPSLNLLGTDYGTSGFIKSGIKFFYTLDKVKPAIQSKS